MEGPIQTQMYPRVSQNDGVEDAAVCARLDIQENLEWMDGKASSRQCAFPLGNVAHGSASNLHESVFREIDL